MELIDLHGRLAKSYSADEIARQQLPIRGIQQGIYLLQLKGTKGELLVKKVVIE
ncbi:MAG: T9SS type A sorting domain-containing protein [Bacteroidota bacterium]